MLCGVFPEGKLAQGSFVARGIRRTTPPSQLQLCQHKLPQKSCFRSLRDLVGKVSFFKGVFITVHEFGVYLSGFIQWSLNNVTG